MAPRPRGSPTGTLIAPSRNAPASSHRTSGSTPSLEPVVRWPESARVVAGAMAASVAVSLAVFLVGAEAVEIRHGLHFGTSSFGFAVSLYYLGAGVGSVPGGWLAEAVGGVRVMRVGCLVAAVLLLALASLARSWATLTGLLVVAGLLSATMQPAVNLFLARRTGPGHQGLAFGVKQAAVPTAALLAGLAVPAVAVTVGWRWAFVAAAGVALAAATRVPRPRTSLAEHRSRARSPLPNGARRPLVVLTVGFGLGIFAATGLSAFTASSAVACGMGASAAGALVAAGGATSVASRIVTGLLADRRGRAHLPVVAVMLAAGSVGYGLLAAASTTGALWLFALGVVVAYGAGWGWNGLFNYAVVRTHPEAPARATGITQVGGRLAGAVGPLVVGLLADHVSYAAAWGVLGAAAVGGAGILLLGRRLLVHRLTGGLPADG